MILVLEDMEERISWLTQYFAHHKIVWTKTVNEFFEKLVFCENIELIILDHDLGGIPKDLNKGSLDHNEHTGMNAAKNMPVVECPVLVWSFNPVHAPQMVSVLNSKGIRSLWAPYGTNQCLAAITRAVLTNEQIKEEL